MIIRDRKSKAARLVVQGDGAWRLFAADSPFWQKTRMPVLDGDGPGQFALAVNKLRRSYFVLEQNGSSLTLAERLLPMSGGWNYRDLGGMPTRHGRRTAWGRLIRSDGLDSLTEPDLIYLASVPLATVVDFRSVSEAERAPDRLPASVKSHRHLAIIPGKVGEANQEDIFRQPLDDGFMENLNRFLALDSEIQDKYREFFRLVQNEASLPLLFHCSAGKDRTGFAAALILFALGVDHETVFADYMASELYLTGKYDEIMTARPEQAVLFAVRPSYIRAAISAIEERYASVENYLTAVLDVDLAKMRDLFLEPN